EIAFALEASNSEQVGETLLEIDVGELQVGLEIGAGRRLGDPEGAPEDAAEGLRLPDRHGEIAAAQIGRDRRASELGVGDGDAGGRQPEVDVEAVEPLEPDRPAVPTLLAAGQQPDGRYVRREVEPFGGERPLQGLPPVEGQNAFEGIAVELEVG